MADRRLIRLRSSCAPTLSLDAFHSNHLRIGDVVSLYALDSKGHNGHEGFLSTLGLVAPSFKMDTDNGTCPQAGRWPLRCGGGQWIVAGSARNIPRFTTTSFTHQSAYSY